MASALDWLGWALLSAQFGSDDLEAYTAVYTWKANQMSHAAMGFFFAVAWYHWATRPRADGKESSRLRVYGRPYLIPVVKLVGDVFTVFLTSRGSPFPIPWGDFAADKTTDLFYWFLGMSVGPLFWTFRKRWWAWAALVAGLGVGYWVGSGWLAQKRTFDDSGLPSGWIRLCQYNTRKAVTNGGDAQREAMEKAVGEYTTAEFGGPGKTVCVIRGGWAVNRSQLAVALGTEFAADTRVVHYHTGARLVEDRQELMRWQTDGRPRPRAVVIDDWPGPFPPPFAYSQKDLRANAHNLPYSSEAGVQAVFNDVESLLAGDPVTLVWAVSCDKDESEKWLAAIKQYVEPAKYKVIEVNLGFPPRPATGPPPPQPPPTKAISSGP